MKLTEGNLLFADIHWVGSALRSGPTVGTGCPHKPSDEICTISPGINCGRKKSPSETAREKAVGGFRGGRGACSRSGMRVAGGG